MSCCVKSSVLRRLAEQKGQKSMLMKGCGQLLACGFALIKTKCSCSQKTLQIYSSNSEHWLWVRPVGFVASRALTKKSQHFLQRYEVCICAHVFVCLCVCLCICVCLCTGCPCGQSVPWAVFSWLCQKHVAWSNTPASHGVKSLVLCTSQSLGQSTVTRFVPHLAENSFITENNHQWFPRRISILQPKTCVQLLSFFPSLCRWRLFSLTSNVTASQLLWQQIHPVRLLVLKESIVLCEQRVPICESSSIMMRDSPHSSKLLMSFFFLSQGAALVSGLHVGLTENVEQISQLIHVQQAILLHN